MLNLPFHERSKKIFISYPNILIIFAEKKSAYKLKYWDVSVSNIICLVLG